MNTDNSSSASPLFFLQLLQSFLKFIRLILPFFPVEDEDDTFDD